MRRQSRNRHAELLRDADRRRFLAFGNDEKLRAEIREIELELLGAIRRVEWGCCCRGSDTKECRRHLGTVVEHDSYSVAWANALRRKRRSNLGHERSQPSIRQWYAARRRQGWSIIGTHSKKVR